MIPAMVRGKYVIRFCLTYEHAKQEHIGREIYVNICIHFTTYRQRLGNDSRGSNLCFEKSKLQRRPKTGQTAENPVGLSKQQLSRLSFTRQVCQESLDRHNSLGELTDVCLPIFVLETKQESS